MEVAHQSVTLRTRLLSAAMVVFVGAIVFSLLGTLLVLLAPRVLEIFGPYYETLVKVPTWVYMTLLPVIAALMYSEDLGTTRLLAFALWGSAIGGVSEVLGTTTGFPFGSYSYTDWLGPKLFGHVPYFIPFSWFAMSIVCFDMAKRLRVGGILRVLVGALFMVFWDVSLDPAMSRAFPFWTYETAGFFYGMPLSNWGGWFLISAIIMGGYELMSGSKRVYHDFAPRFYLVNCAFPLLLSLAYGLYLAVLAGATAAVAAVYLSTRSRAARQAAYPA